MAQAPPLRFGLVTRGKGIPIMPNIALACTILPDSPPARLIEWSRAAEDAGFSGVFMTEANNDSLACSPALGLPTQPLKLGTAMTNIYIHHPSLPATPAL